MNTFQRNYTFIFAIFIIVYIAIKILKGDITIH